MMEGLPRQMASLEHALLILPIAALLGSALGVIRPIRRVLVRLLKTRLSRNRGGDGRLPVHPTGDPENALGILFSIDRELIRNSQGASETVRSKNRSRRGSNRRRAFGSSTRCAPNSANASR